MNRWRIGGLLIVALLAAWLALRGCTPEEPQTPSAPLAPRTVFHASKPMQVEVAAAPDATGKAADLTWLEYELRRLLSRGRMRVAPVSFDEPDLSRKSTDTFTLRMEIAADGSHASLMLVAPDGVVERRERVPLANHARLGTLSGLATRLPQFLDAPQASHDWVSLIGTDDPEAYETYVSGTLELLGPAGQGFTRPPAGRRAHTVERLEALTRREPRFARAWGVLATGYLSLGSEDAESLAQLAEAGAERALSLDDEIAEAHAALGLVHLRRNEWIAAREQFDRALMLDANDAPALEGLACLLVDAGRYEEARSIAGRAVSLQPRNIGARECLAYADTTAPGARTDDARDAASRSAPAARAQALAAILGGDIASGRRLLRTSVRRQDLDQWAEPLIRAAGNRRHVPDALRAITRAANEGRIDASTEILCGAALRQSEFVFNRMSRLQRRSGHVPLRILWMPQTAFLRRHRRFEEVVAAAALPAFWQERGTPDICATEPAVYGCRLRSPAAGAQQEREKPAQRKSLQCGDCREVAPIMPPPPGKPMVRNPAAQP